jgi:transcription elongation factor Elf1
MNCDWVEKNDGFECPNCGKFKPVQTNRFCPASNGLGEQVAKVTKALKIPECGGCKKRREALNRMSTKVKQWVKNEKND